MKKIYLQLKERWGLESPWQVALVIFIFSISGISVLYVRKMIFQWLGFDAQTPLWEETMIWIVVVVPSYQIIFMLFGTLLGQFEFVWRFEKKNVQRIKKLFTYLTSFY